MDKQVKDLLLAYIDWEKKQPKNVHQIDTGEYKIVIDGVEVDIPEEEDLIASFEEEAAKLEVTVDYYMEEFLWHIKRLMILCLNSYRQNTRSKMWWNSLRIILMRSTCTCIWTRFIMSSKDSYLYVLDYWVPFPASEYGGLIVLIAESDQDAFEILSNEEQLESDYGHLIMEQIVKSTKIKLAEEHESGIIDVFCT